MSSHESTRMGTNGGRVTAGELAIGIMLAVGVLLATVAGSYIIFAWLKNSLGILGQ